MATVAESISQLVKVRSLGGEDKVTLIYDDCWGHHHEMLRDKKEHVSKTLKRIILSSLKSQKQKNRKRKRTQVTEGSELPIEAHLYTPTGELVQDEVFNIDAWEEGSTLELGSVKYRVRVNIPTVLSLKLPKCIMTGCPTVPEVTLEFSDFYSCQWEWLRHPADSGFTSSGTDPQLLGKSHTYWPSESDSGCKLLLKCIPVSSNGRTGKPVTTLSNPVTESPKVTPITRRHLLTPARLAQSDTFRMVTYNTLAGMFTAESDPYSREVLYPYCDPAALDIEYRRGKIVHELIGYNADIMALQEVGTDCYNKFFLPALRDIGYSGCHQQKSGTIHEGEAIFYDTAKFSLVSRESTLISDFLADDQSCFELHEGLKAAPSLLKEVMRKCSIILVTLLRFNQQPDRVLLVANTHLYYHPKGDLVRLIQTAVMVNYLRTRLEKYSRLLADETRIATVIGGDLNSCPCIAAYEYLVSGHVGKDHRDWKAYRQKGIPRCQCYYKHNFGSKEADPGAPSDDNSLPPHIQFKLDHDGPMTSAENHFDGMELRHGFRFHNVTGTEICTNFTGGFKAVLDYIFIDSEHLAVERVVPLPSMGEVSEFVALPSVYFPSDHLALVADLKVK